MDLCITKTYKRFPWKQESTDLLIDLYAKKIDIFLDSSRTQLPAWKWIVYELKKNIKDSTKELISVLRVTNKIASLKKKFKNLYFDTNRTDTEKQRIFPFYIKMHDLFTDYATKQLHNSSFYNKSITQESINASIDETDVTSYVVQLLNEEDMDKTSLTILPYNEDRENFSEHVSSVHYSSSQNSHFSKSAIDMSENSSKSETEKVRIKLAEIPSDAIYIHKEKMRIDPNTPFNRHVNNSMILNQRSLMLHKSQAPSMKRRLLDDLGEPPCQKKKNVTHSSDRLSNSLYHDNEYLIEALDECELSDITMRQSKAIYCNTSTEESKMSSSCESFGVLEQSKMHSKMKGELKLSPEQETIQSILTIPPCPVFSDDDSSICEFRMADTNSETIRCIPRQIVPRNLIVNDNSNISETSQISLMKLNEAQAPIWFQNFLTKYDADIKNINLKLDKLINSNKSTSPVLIHPKVLRIKRDSI